ncbi:hypothetical protein SDC9_199679 [bioreactor metagenome]|uniref:Uncharacterized protein n=1 Tax=bioreactor metagenome TaxID=1076179 RepID=A0A645IL87_9ZZZZ
MLAAHDGGIGVLHAYTQDPRPEAGKIRHGFGHRAAQAAQDGMLLHGDKQGKLPGQAGYKFLIQRLDGGKAVHPRMDPLLFQKVRGGHGLGQDAPGA